MKLSTIFFVIAGLLCCQAFAEKVTYATWNIRYANAKDSANGDGWGKRAPRIAEVIQFYDFDIISMQEPDKNQVADLAALLPDYDYVQADSTYFHPIFFKKSLFKKVDSGMFWYSESGERGSIGWEASQIRFCSWAKLMPKQGKKKKPLFIFNGHWDHKSWEARKESAKLTVRKIKEIAGTGLAIFSGDTNVEPDKEPYNTMQRSSVLMDSKKASKIVYAPNNSFNNFDPNTYGKWQIDHVFVSPTFNVMRYGILNERYYDGKKWRYHSDHLPIMVNLEY
jgi:endonuclease/exonuclease/phosphatase family metal-dependent hydrolase